MQDDTRTLMKPQKTKTRYGILAQSAHSTIRKHRFRKRLYIPSIIAALILAGAAGYWLYVLRSTKTIKSWQSAVISLASVDYLEQVYRFGANADGLGPKGTITMRSDFSDPATPKSKGTFDMDVGVIGRTIKLKSDFLCVSEVECYIKYIAFTAPEELTTEKPAYLNTWLQFDPTTNNNNSADVFGIVGNVNTVLGELIIGNITGHAKQMIHDAAKNKNTYNIMSTRVSKNSNQNSVQYDIRANTDDLISINSAVANQYSIANNYDAQTAFVDTFSAWVDTTTNTIFKLEYEQGDTTTSIHYSVHSEKPNIQAPVDYLKPQEYSRVI